MKKLFLFGMLLLAASENILACPVCTSPQATQVRNYLFGAELFYNLFALMLPFVIFSLIAAGIYYYDFPSQNKKNI